MLNYVAKKVYAQSRFTGFFIITMLNKLWSKPGLFCLQYQQANRRSIDENIPVCLAMYATVSK